MCDEDFCRICNIKLTENDCYRCSTCNQLISINKKKKNFNSGSVQKALKDSAYINPDGERFYLCYYTGIPCSVKEKSKYDSSSLSNAFDLTFDHLYPSSKYYVDSDGLVVCLNIINQIKSNIPDSIFKDVIISLGEHFKEATPSKYTPEFERQFKGILNIGIN
jgi:hypothetical protein